MRSRRRIPESNGALHPSSSYRSCWIEAGAELADSVWTYVAGRGITQVLAILATLTGGEVRNRPRRPREISRLVPPGASRDIPVLSPVVAEQGHQREITRTVAIPAT